MCIGLDYSEQGSQNGRGWMTIEAFLIRATTRLTNSGRFPVFSDHNVYGEIGYDAAVCALKYEPWIVEAYNASTGSPSSLQIVDKGSDGASLPSGKIRGDPIENTRYLNTTAKGKDSVFVSAQGSSIYLLMNDDGPGDYYPTPTVGPIATLCTGVFLTPTYSTGSFFHRW